MGVPTFGGSDGSSGTRGGGDIHPPPPEYHSPIHRDSSDIRAVSGDGAAARSAGCTAMVGAGGSGARGQDKGGGGDNGGGGAEGQGENGERDWRLKRMGYIAPKYHRDGA